MSRRKAVNHKGPHKYLRIKWKSRVSAGDPYIIYKCMIPGCTHYVPRDLVVGNESICWKCGDSFQMSLATANLAKPHCLKCTKGKRGEASVDDVMTNLDRILGGI